ncbi:hypothetical protein CEXT_92541, partial [Caerostris extrusa]
KERKKRRFLLLNRKGEKCKQFWNDAARRAGGGNVTSLLETRCGTPRIPLEEESAFSRSLLASPHSSSMIAWCMRKS